MKIKVHFKSTCFYSFFISFLLILLESFILSLFFTLTKNESLGYFIGYIVTLLVLFFIYRKKLLNDAKNFKSSIKGTFKHLLIIYITAMILMYISNLVLYYTVGSIASNETNVRQMIFNSPLLMGISFGIFAPIVEELIFRYPYKEAKTNKFLKFIIYTLVFAFAHIVGDLSLTGILYIIPYTFLSTGIGYSFYKTDNIYTSMIAHIFNNTFTIIILIIFGG